MFGWFRVVTRVLVLCDTCLEIAHCQKILVIGQGLELRYKSFALYFFLIVWQTKKMRQIFRLKDKNVHPSYVPVYQGNCSCGETYIGETMRNLETRIAEHDSEPAKHLKHHPNHSITWKKLHWTCSLDNYTKTNLHETTLGRNYSTLRRNYTFC